MRRLNVGCGRDIRPAADGWCNLDAVDLPGVDVVHDIFKFPWPFEDGSFDHVLLRHVMEHIPHVVDHPSHKDGFLVVMEELHRILRPGGRMEVFSPHHASEDQLADPTHTRALHPRNFEYFDPKHSFGFYSSARFRPIVSEVSRRSIIGRRRFYVGASHLGLTEHIALRLPFLRRALERVPAEIHLILEKAPDDQPE